jgi:hypothetical protein
MLHQVQKWIPAFAGMTNSCRTNEGEIPVSGWTRANACEHTAKRARLEIKSRSFVVTLVLGERYGFAGGGVGVLVGTGCAGAPGVPKSTVGTALFSFGAVKYFRCFAPVIFAVITVGNVRM